jgi:hypothetical protein
MTDKQGTNWFLVCSNWIIHRCDLLVRMANVKSLRIIPPVAVLSLSVGSVAPTPPKDPPGKLIDIGGYRLHLNCTGKGKDTVLLEYGSSGNSME